MPKMEIKANSYIQGYTFFSVESIRSKYPKQNKNCIVTHNVIFL